MTRRWRRRRLLRKIRERRAAWVLVRLAGEEIAEIGTSAVPLIEKKTLKGVIRRVR